LIALVSLAVGTFCFDFFEQAHVIDKYFLYFTYGFVKVIFRDYRFSYFDQLVKLVNEVFCSKRWLVYIKIAEVLCAVILLPSSASIAANVK
jgi:hypothetical protein